jgi:hypothetical protein
MVANAAAHGGSSSGGKRQFCGSRETIIGALKVDKAIVAM